MVEETIPVFETFCRHQDSAVPGAEKQYNSNYHRIVKLYAQFASPQSTEHFKTPLSHPLAMQWRNVGLKAIHSVVQSETLIADSGRRLSIIVPVILQNLYTGDRNMLMALHLKNASTGKSDMPPPRRRRTSSITVQTVDTIDGNVADASGSAADSDKAAEMEVRLLALKCLERIFSVGSNRLQIRLATGMVLQFITSRPSVSITANTSVSEADQILAWAPSLMEMIAKWSPVQDRFLTVFTAAETLLRTPAHDRKLTQHIILALVIDSLLKSSVNMIGLSVIDVLQGLLNHILRVLQFTPTPEPTIDVEDMTAAGQAVVNENATAAIEATSPSPAPYVTRERLIALLQKCVGDMTVHIYYADQVSDMVRAILVRIKPLPSLESSVSDSASGANALETNGRTGRDEQQSELLFFQTVPARLVALEAIKGLLVVANLRTARAGAGVESRNKTSIRVWDGTHWMMRDMDSQVRYAYADALLSWLQLETGKQDLLVADTSRRISRSLSKREKNDKIDKTIKRAVSASMSADKAAQIVRSNFLQSLHLVLYENALDAPTRDSNVLLIHLLLTNLVEHLGVNATRFGIPMIIRLQQDLEANPALQSPSAQVHIGSLVHGYFAALSEKFDFETSKVGIEIQSEISRRKKAGTWFEKIRLPAIGLNQIAQTPEKSPDEENVQRSEAKVNLVPFTAAGELVRRIEESYSSMMTASQSPPSSPRPFNMQVTGYVQAMTLPEKPSSELSLPPDVREQMLTPWSRELCTAALEKESATTSSVSGSRTGHSLRRVRSQLNEAALPIDVASSGHRYDQMAFPMESTGSLHCYPKRHGANESPRTVSSRDSTLRVNDLKRMLSVSQDSNSRRASPLRGPPNVTSDSRPTSSSESMLSGAFSGSDLDGELQSGSRPQSSKENGGAIESEVPLANGKAPIGRSNDSKPVDRSTSLSREKPDDIPPVPPLPPGLNIPGGFPNDSSLSRASPTLISIPDRPMTAPGPRQPGSIRSKKEGTSSRNPQIRSLSGRKSRSSSNLAGSTAAAARPFSDEDDTHEINGLGLDKLLEDILPGLGSGKTSPIQRNISLTYSYKRRNISDKSSITDTLGDHTGRRKTSDHRRGLGIGPPPY